MDIKGGGLFGEGAVAGVSLPMGPRTPGGVFGRKAFSGCGCGATESELMDAADTLNWGVDLTVPTFQQDPLVEAERAKWEGETLAAPSTSTSIGGVLFLTAIAGVAIWALAKATG